jgi:hypothetical protein
MMLINRLRSISAHSRFKKSTINPLTPTEPDAPDLNRVDDAGGSEGWGEMALKYKVGTP